MFVETWEEATRLQRRILERPHTFWGGVCWSTATLPTGWLAMVPAAQCREAGEGRDILMVAVALITQGNADMLAMAHDYILFWILWAAKP